MSSNVALIQEADELIRDNDVFPASGRQAIVEQLYGSAVLDAYLVGYKSADEKDDEQAGIDRMKLRRLMVSKLSESEFYDMVFDLEDINKNLLPEGSIADKMRELILFLERRGRLPELLAYCRETFPYVTWPQTNTANEGSDLLVPRIDTAIVVDMARPAVGNVARYLDEQETPANFIVVRHPEDRFLSRDDDWGAAVQGFSAATSRFKARYPGGDMHFFLAGPGALLFGMGGIWGTVDNAAVYHYQDGDYWPVYTLTRELRR